MPQTRAEEFLLAVEPSSPIMLYRAFYDVLGAYPSYKAQVIGSCVGHGHAHANDLLQAIEIYFGEPTTWKETDAEATYAISRMAGHILGPFDGSYGSAAALGMTHIGIVDREMLGADGIDSGQLAKSWGRTGLPQKYVDMASKFKLGSVSKITTIPQAVSVLWNGRPITICSSQGFTMTRDSEGYCDAEGSWSHCMHLLGYDPGNNRSGKPRFLIGQSWGPNTPKGPLFLDQPDWTFWADAALVERRILGADDSWALFKSPDFAPRAMPPDWTRQLA